MADLDEQQHLLKIVCAWCLSIMRDAPGPVSHGICETCIPKFEAGEKPEPRNP